MQEDVRKQYAELTTGSVMLRMTYDQLAPHLPPEVLAQLYSVGSYLSNMLVDMELIYGQRVMQSAERTDD